MVNYSRLSNTWNNTKDSQTTAKRLQKLWETQPTPNTAMEDCSVFLHSIDVESPKTGTGTWNNKCTKDTPYPWCPSPTFKQGQLTLPLEGMSFTLVNKYITRDHGRTLCCGTGTFGLVFDYENIGNDQTISPLCYYATDGATLSRSKCGCGSYGLQLPSGCNPTSSGNYNLSTCDPNKTGNQLYNTNLLIRNAINKLTFPYTSSQCSQNYDQFKELSYIAKPLVPPATSKIGTWNEVVIRSWLDVDFDIVPLTAFFYQYENLESQQNIYKIAALFKTITGKTLPVVSFDTKDGFRPEVPPTGF